MRSFLFVLFALVMLSACSFSNEDSGLVGKRTTDPTLAAPPIHLMVAPGR